MRRVYGLRYYNWSLKLWFLGVVSYLQLWPVHFVVFRRDCDLFESETAHTFPTYIHAMWYLTRARDEWTEGPYQFWQISRKEFKSFQSSHRDRILEAFEDGRGSAVVI